MIDRMATIIARRRCGSKSGGGVSGFGARPLLWLGLMIALSAPAHSQVTELSRREEFVLGNAQFVLLHELAHLIINEKRVPILGPEEFAADYIAAMMLIRPPVVPAAGYEMLLRFAVDTADGFVIAWEQSQGLAMPLPYWGSHALTVQRFSTIACLLYGSDPQRFAELPKRVEMLPARALSCPGEYAKAAHAVDWLFEAYGKAAGEPAGASMTIRFEDPPTRTSQRLLGLIRDQGFVDRTLARFNDFFSLDAPATFTMRACGQPQALWLPETRELVFCYELLDAYALMGLSQDAGALRPLLGE
jgi:hypothetical protein